jgi:hypothetical protein
VKLVIPRLGRIEGQVVVRDGEELPRAFNVTIHQQSHRSSPRPEPKPFQTTDGRFALDGIGPGRYDVVVRADGYSAGTATVALAEGETASTSVEIQRAGSVAGRVTAGGRPVAQALVRPDFRPDFRGAWRGEIDTARTDDKGQYAIDGLPPGSHALRISAQGFVETSVKVDVVAGKESRADVELSRGRQLRGRVVDAEGRPIAGASITAQRIWSIPQTDAGGSFTIEGVSDEKVTITARKDGYIDGHAIVEPGPQPDITIVLRRGATISGHVRGLSPAELAAVEVSAFNAAASSHARGRVDAAGAFALQGVADGEVMVMAALKGARPRSTRATVRVQNGFAPPVELDFGAGIAVRGRVTARGRAVQGQIAFVAEAQPIPATSELGRDGSYFVQLAAPGEYRVLVIPSGSGPFQSRVSVAGEMVHDIEIGGGALSGRVIDAETRAPIVGAVVRQMIRELRTGADGRFTLGDVPHGPQTIVANAPGYAPAVHSFTMTDAPQELEIALPRGTMVHVRLVDAVSGQPVPGGVAIADQAAAQILTGGNVPPEGLQLHLAVGTYQVHAMAEGYARKMVKLSVPGPPLTMALERLK